MGDTKDLRQKEAIRKLQEMVGKNDTCMFCTQIQSNQPFETRPMTTQKVDDEGCFWFLSEKDSDLNAGIRIDPRVQLLYASSTHEGFLTVAGHASIGTDKAKIKELWKPLAKAWFTEGEEDPRITVIKVLPEEAHYWDTKHGKAVAFVKIVAAMVTGHTMDDGIDGEIITR